MTWYEEEELNVLRQSNQYMEISYHQLEAHTAVLERARKDVLEQVREEKEKMRKEERQNAEMKNQLERMRREASTLSVRIREAGDRERQLREMQRPPPGSPEGVASLRGDLEDIRGEGTTAAGIASEAGDRSQRPLEEMGQPPQTHSWAMSLMSMGGNSSGGGADRDTRGDRDSNWLSGSARVDASARDTHSRPGETWSASMDGGGGPRLGRIFPNPADREGV